MSITSWLHLIISWFDHKWLKNTYQTCSNSTVCKILSILFFFSFIYKVKKFTTPAFCLKAHVGIFSRINLTFIWCVKYTYFVPLHIIFLEVSWVTFSGFHFFQWVCKLVLTCLICICSCKYATRCSVIASHYSLPPLQHPPSLPMQGWGLGAEITS